MPPRRTWRLATDVSTRTGITLPYLAKIFHAVALAGLVESKRGYRGGFALARPANRISLLDVAEAVEGPNWKAPCVLGLTSCAQVQACPTHEFWMRELARIERELRKTTLAQVGGFRRRSAGRTSSLG